MNSESKEVPLKLVQIVYYKTHEYYMFPMHEDKITNLTCSFDFNKENTNIPIEEKIKSLK